MTDIKEMANELADSLREGGEAFPASAFGLDDRAGRRLYVGPDRDFICVDNDHRRQLDYYGGFEYINDEFITVIGDWTFYSEAALRVFEAISRLESKES